MTKAASTMLQLLGCFILSVTAAIVLMKGVSYFDCRETLTLALPVLPVIFPVFYKVLAREPAARILSQVSPPAGFWARHFSLRFSEMRSLQTILIGVSLSILAKYSVEAVFLYTFYRRSGLPFHEVFGEGGDSLVGCFLRGELLTVATSQILPLLALEVIVLTAIGGVWIGAMSSRAPVLEGIFAGTILTLFASLTNLAVLYAHIETLASRAAYVLGADYSQLLPLAGLMLQVFLYGCWTIAGQQWRRQRLVAAPARSRRSR